MAAYWLEIDCMVPESNDQSPPKRCSVSTKLRVRAAAVFAAHAQQPGRHQRIEAEADQGQGGGGGERVAPLAISIGNPVEQVEQHGDRHDEVERPVEDVPEPHEPRPAEEPVLHRLLVEQPDGPLDADDLPGVRERLVGAHRRRAEEVADRGVDAVEAGDDRDLAPPPQSQRRDHRALGSRSCGDHVARCAHVALHRRHTLAPSARRRSLSGLGSTARAAF